VPYKVVGPKGGAVLQVVNAPEVLAAFTKLGLVGSKKVLRPAIAAGAEKIAEKWRDEAPEDMGYFKESIQVDTSGQAIGAALSGADSDEALAQIYPHPVGGVPEDEQPARYAGTLEFGGTLGPKQHNAVIPANPSGRRAIAASSDECVDEIESHLQAALAALGFL
jgi:hypothetical protein